MTAPVTQRPRARLDLLEQFVYFAGEADIELAERYYAAVAQTCGLLAGQPLAGAAYESGIAGLSELRRFPVRDFEHI